MDIGQALVQKELEKELMKDVYIGLAIGPADPVRTSLVDATLRAHDLIGRNVFVVYDPHLLPAKSTMDKLKLMAAAGRTVLREQSLPGTGGAQKEAITLPISQHGAEVVVHQEPEKVDFAERWVTHVVRPIKKEGYQSVVPCRTVDSYSTYYPFQVRTEQRANDIITRIREKTIGMALDEMYGPASFSEQAWTAVSSYDGKKWNMHMGPHDTIKKNGGRIGKVMVDYHHPELQVEAEMKDPKFSAKRIDQMIYCVNAIQQHHFTLNKELYNNQRPAEINTLDDLAAAFPVYKDWNEFSAVIKNSV